MILEEILLSIPYEILQGCEQIEITGVTEDSREVKEGILFCCIKGQHADGHKLIQTAVQNGASALLVERRPTVPVPDGIAVIMVSDTRRAAGKAAAAFYGHPAEKLHMIGVTGTKGKTSLTYMLQQILQQAQISCGLIGTNGYQYGHRMESVAHTTPTACCLQRILWEMVEAGCQAVVMEVSSIGMKEKRCSGIIFEYGIFTNFAPDHIGGEEHKSIEEYLFWKMQMFCQCKNGILNFDDPVSRQICTRISSCKWAGYGIENNKKSIESIAESWYLAANPSGFQNDTILGMTFTLQTAEELSVPIRLPMPGLYNVSNALGAAACFLELIGGKKQKTHANCLQKGLSQVRIPGRTEVIGTYHGAKIMVDYAHNASGLEKLLVGLKEYAPSRILCVFGCGGGRSKVRRREMGEVSSRLADLVILTEDNSREEEPEEIIREIRQGMDTDTVCQVILDRKAAIFYALEKAQPGDFVIVAGKGHEAYQEKKGVRYPFSDREVIEELMKSIVGRNQ